MVRLRPREFYSVFTKTEIKILEKLFNESKSEITSSLFCRKIATRFNCSSGRARNSLVNWTEVRSWFSERQKDHNGQSTSSPNDHQTLLARPTNPPSDKANGDSKMPEGQKFPDISQFQFEAKSTDGALYLTSGEAEVLVRYTGFGAEEDEWVNVKKAVRERSMPLEHWECHKLKVGHFVLCFQEWRDRASHYDGRIIHIQRRMHDIRGCRCLFLIRYDHDNSEEKVQLRRLCCRPSR